MRRFIELWVWQRSRELVAAIYRLTARFPDDERFCLVSQVRRAVVSMPANIAEGSKRRHPQDFVRFLNIAESSAAEVECLLYLMGDLGYVDPTTGQKLLQEVDEISRMLRVLQKKVEQASR